MVNGRNEILNSCYVTAFGVQNIVGRSCGKLKLLNAQVSKTRKFSRNRPLFSVWEHLIGGIEWGVSKININIIKRSKIKKPENLIRR